MCLFQDMKDHLLILSTSLKIIEETKSFLFSKFDMKDLEETDVILGMKITKSPEVIALSHSTKKMIREI